MVDIRIQPQRPSQHHHVLQRALCTFKFALRRFTYALRDVGYTTACARYMTSPATSITPTHTTNTPRPVSEHWLHWRSTLWPNPCTQFWYNQHVRAFSACESAQASTHLAQWPVAPWRAWRRVHRLFVAGWIPRRSHNRRATERARRGHETRVKHRRVGVPWTPTSHSPPR